MAMKNSDHTHDSEVSDQRIVQGVPTGPVRIFTASNESMFIYSSGTQVKVTDNNSALIKYWLLEPGLQTSFRIRCFGTNLCLTETSTSELVLQLKETSYLQWWDLWRTAEGEDWVYIATVSHNGNRVFNVVGSQKDDKVIVADRVGSLNQKFRLVDW
jgi:hypothetical protein